jgi:hypothetical protein
MMYDDADDPALADFQRRMQAGGFPSGSAAEWYGLVQRMRQRADYFERALIRHLKYDLGMTWAQVAEAVDANLSSRQAAQAKWKRLIDDERWKPGSAGRGGWPKGRPRKPSDA